MKPLDSSSKQENKEQESFIFQIFANDTCSWTAPHEVTAAPVTVCESTLCLHVWLQPPLLLEVPRVEGRETEMHTHYNLPAEGCFPSCETANLHYKLPSTGYSESLTMIPNKHSVQLSDSCLRSLSALYIHSSCFPT